VSTTNEAMATNAATIDSGTKITIALLLLLGFAIGAIYLTKREKRNNTFYGKYKLLLIVPANRLTPELKIGSISNNEVNVLIANAIRAYCFATGNKKGNQVMQTVECSDSQIDYKTENRIFLQLELSAESDIITERDNLGIKSKIEPNSNGNLLQIKALKTARSTSEFYLI
jgi:hypothetical protein